MANAIQNDLLTSKVLFCTAKKVIYGWQIFPRIHGAYLQTIESGGNKMKNSLIIGTMLGLATATALYCSMTNNSLKKAKRAFVNKIEDIIM